MSCKKCGRCCEFAYLPLVPGITPKWVEFFRRRSGAISSHTDAAGNYHLQLGRCPFLSPNGTCRIYEIRPEVCREYPRGDQDLVPGCTLLDKEEKEEDETSTTI